MNGMREQHWPEALADFIEARREMPFEWGPNDCCAFAAAALEAMTGERPPLPAYASERDAARLLREAPLRERVDELYGPEIVPAFAQRGDLVLLDLDGRATLGVCVGDEVVAPGPDGVLTFPRSLALAAWKV